MAEIVAARLLQGSGWTGPARVVIEHDVVAAIEPATRPPDVDVLTAGFVDLQVNGIDTTDVAAAGDRGWDELDRALLDQGVTAWCPTLVSMPLAAYAHPLARIAAAMQRTGCPEILGVHLEGPFLGTAPGAHPEELLGDPDLDWLASLPDHVRLVTLGPERAGAVQATELLATRGVTVSIGHSTASIEQLDACVEAGATMVTHLFNAMSGLHHRQPGVAAWALRHPTIRASLIADLVHVDAAMIDLAIRLLGPDRAILVTDAVAWKAGRVASIGVELRDGAPRLADGTLAGSALRIHDAVRHAVHAGVELATALWAASRNPARVVGAGATHGIVGIGRRADLVALTPALAIEQVWLGGLPVGR